MEGAPRIPFFSFKLKASKSSIETDILQNFIESEYGEAANSYQKEFTELNQLCKNMANATPDMNGLSILKKYYTQLQFLKTRFPMEECEACAMQITWEDIYAGEIVCHSDICFEEASVLHNIGAIQSILGSNENRMELDNVKTACTYFMGAAWCFQRVTEVFTGEVAPDLDCDLMKLKNVIMLAQAQECVFLKSLIDGRKSGINAKIAQQIVVFYTQISDLLTNSPTIYKIIPSKTNKYYSRVFQMKVNYYTAQVCFFSGMSAEETDQYGLRCAWFRKAKDNILKCIETAKAIKESDWDETLNFVHDVIVAKAASVEKENGTIYYDKIPDEQDLPVITPALLVKCLPFDVSDTQQDIFKRLIPLSAHQASSVYSEEAATVLRNMSDRVEKKDLELAECLSSLQIDLNSFNLETDPPMPQELYTCCAQLSVEQTDAQKNIK